MSYHGILNCRGNILPLGERTLIMGILNVTPDSFSDGGCYYSPEQAWQKAWEMVQEGVDIIDVGAQSTRPGYRPVTYEEEQKRLAPVISRLVRELPVPVSVDTSNPLIAAEALQQGAGIINDQQALAGEDEGGRQTAAMAELVRHYQVPVILMHNRKLPRQCEAIECVCTDLSERIAYAEQSGIKREQIVLDPGIGFGKTPEQNMQLIRELHRLECLQLPLLLGASRKSFIGAALDLPVGERLEGSLAAACLGVINGAAIIRVHDVKETVRAVRMCEAILRA